MFFVASLKKIDEKNYINPCGTSYGTYIHDLKTLRGLEKRFNNWVKQPQDVEKVAVYEFGESEKFNSKNWRLKGLYKVIDGKISTFTRELDTTLKIQLD